MQRWSRSIGHLLTLTHVSNESSKAPQQRGLLAVASQTQARSSGLVQYKPTGYTIHSEDFSLFFTQTHANKAVTGERCMS